MNSAHPTPQSALSTRRLVLRTFQSPGDVLMLTAAVRDLHLAHPHRFQTDVRTSAPDIWLNNPHITSLEEHAAGVERIDMHYPLIHQCDRRPYHFIHGYAQYLEQQLGVPVPLTRFAGDIHLSPEERRAERPFAELGVADGFWIVMAGGKYDFTAKWWNPASYQAVVDHFQGRIPFVQCGEAGHFHPRLRGVVDLVGKTTLRQFIVLMHHAAGVLCPVTFAMHLAAAVETRPGKPPHRACVVIAGGREPAHWEQYPHHQFLTTVGMLPCCRGGACWRSRCQLVGDGDSKDREHLCERPVQVTPELRIARCQEMITPADVIRRIEMFREGTGDRAQGTEQGSGVGIQDSGSRKLPLPPGEGWGEGIPSVGNALRAVPPSVGNALGGVPPRDKVAPTFRGGECPRDEVAPTLRGGECPRDEGDREPRHGVPRLLCVSDAASSPPARRMLIDFRHGLGDAVQLTTVLAHLRHYHPDWQIDVAAGIGKQSAYKSLADNIFVRDRQPIDRAAYDECFDLAWDECPTSYADCPSTKAEYCLKSVFGLEPLADRCRYQIAIGDDARAAAQAYLEAVCGPGRAPDGRYPAVLIHYQANTSADKKDLPHELIRRVCQTVIESGYVPIILDWDRRSPLPDGVQIHCPSAEAALWGNTGTGDAETLAALIEQASLFIGVDSGPLHVAGKGPGVGGLRSEERHQLPLPPGEGRGEGASVGNALCGVPPSVGNGLRAVPPSVGNALCGVPPAAQVPEFGGDNSAFRTPHSALPPTPHSALPLTPAIAIWTGHHPLHYFGLADHVTHLVPEHHASLLRGDRSVGQAFFEKHYRHRTYARLDEALLALARETLPGEVDGLVRSHRFWVRGDNVEQDLVIVRDIAEQDSYRIAELAVPGPVAVDVGAHIGVFSRAFRRRHPSARVVAVECCPENIPALERNIGDFATIVPAALTYEKDVALLNAVYPGCESTGGSAVISRDQLRELLSKGVNHNNSALRTPHSALPYWLDGRPLATLTLEALMAQTGIDHIDVLKLDCEGSEFSILENTTSLDRIGAIIGEFHDRARFDDLVRRKFADWRLRILRDEDPGTFWLINPKLPLPPGEGRGEGLLPSAGNALRGVPPAVSAALTADSRV